MALNFVEPVTTYEKRESVVDLGKEYEYLISALYVLKCCEYDDLEDFYVTTNNKKFGDFDDLEIHARLKSDKQIKFLFQFKYRCNNEKVTTNTLIKKCVHNKKNKFFLPHYFEVISKLRETENSVETLYILYTNLNVELKEGEILQIQQNKNFRVTEIQDLPFKNLLINSENVNNLCFGFTPINGYPNVEGCNNFYLIGGQPDLDQVKRKAEAMLQAMFHYLIYQNYQQFIRSWWINNFVLHKKQIILKMVILVLSSYIKVTSNGKQNGKTKILENVILDFNITKIEETDTADICCIWPQFIKEEELKLGQMIFEMNPNNMSDLQTTILLWCLKKGPLIIDVKDLEQEVLESVFKMMQNHHIERSMILLGKPKKSLECNRNTFHTLFDLQSLKSQNKIFYRGLTQNYKISIQGKESITLEELLEIDTEISEKLTVQDLLIMSQKESLCVGAPLENTPNLHVGRTLSLWIVNIEELPEISQSTFIVKCNSSFKRRIIQKMCTNQKFVFVCDSEKIAEHFYKLSKNRTNVYAFQQIDDDNCVLILQKGGLHLKYRKSFQDVDIVNKLDTFLNVICASPGMGKSQMLEYLRKHSKRDEWTIHVDSIGLNSFLAKNPNYEEFKSKILSLDVETDNLDIHFISVLFKKKKTVVYLDGLDDINSSYVDALLEFLKMFITEGGRIWLSSRENLRQKLCDALGAVPIDLLHLDKQQRCCYIHKKLKQRYNKENLEKIEDALSETLQFTKSEELLGVPLQLHLITEVFLNTPEVYKKLDDQKVLVLTQVYKFFFQSQIKMGFTRIGIDEFKVAHLGLNYQEQLEKYEIPALKACLESEDFEKLEVQEVINFRNIKEEGDKFGIIKSFNENEIVFHHQTYAEYFASIWFTKNQNQFVVLQKELFTKKYENLRRMIDIMLAEENPSHLSIIYKNFKNLQDLWEVDKAGRTIAHLAFSYADKTKFKQRESDIKIIDQILKDPAILLIEDQLLGAIPVKYALLAKCIYPLEKCLQPNACPDSKFIAEVFVKEVLKFDDLANTQFERYSLLHLVSQKEGNADMLEALISNGIFVDCKNTEGETPLCVATQNQCVNNVRFLLEKGASSIEFDKRGKCPVFAAFALKQPNTELVKIFFEFGFDLNITDRNKNTLLHVACQEGCLENVSALIEKGVNLESLNHKMESALHCAALSKRATLQILKLLLSLGLEVNAKNHHGNTPLLLACKKGCIESVMLLYENRGDVKATNNNGNNALHSASYCQKPNVEVMSFLLECGLNVNAADNDGDTPFLEACERGCMENVKFLIENEAKINAINNEGQNALHRASSTKVANSEVIKLLIGNGISKTEGCGLDINSTDFCGNTALLYACVHSCIDNVMVLIEHGANIFAENNHNYNALHFASNANEVDTEILDLLLNCGLTFDVKNDIKDLEKT